MMHFASLACTVDRVGKILTWWYKEARHGIARHNSAHTHTILFVEVDRILIAFYLLSFYFLSFANVLHCAGDTGVR